MCSEREDKYKKALESIVLTDTLLDDMIDADPMLDPRGMIAAAYVGIIRKAKEALN